MVSIRQMKSMEYMLEEWVIKPNDAHVVLWPFPNRAIRRIAVGQRVCRQAQRKRIANQLCSAYQLR